MDPKDAAELWRKALPKLVARAWSDEGFKKRLQSAPLEVFKEYNLPVLPDIKYEVKEGLLPHTDAGPSFAVTMTVTVPPKPPDLQEERLEDVLTEALRKSERARSICCF